VGRKKFRLILFLVVTIMSLQFGLAWGLHVEKEHPEYEFMPIQAVKEFTLWNLDWQIEVKRRDNAQETQEKAEVLK